ncbi:MAG: Triosephosphate isomerase [Candidatus Saccharibacteria bacterium]|nr:Triosephosphate isomerase [Candidatus Saccharibacteria bacterium]
MRKLLIVGNWKMHLNTMQASILLHRLQERIRIYRDIEVVIAPSMLVLQPLSVQLDRRKFRLAAQNAYYKDDGPFTGEVSFTMLRELVHYAIIGHSERRHVFGETLPEVALKMEAAVRNGIIPILCVGETKTERLAGHTRRVLHDQVTTALKGLTGEDIENLVIAYEPVWALSDGDPTHHVHTKPDDVAAAEKVIRHNITELYGKKAAENVRVLYGGSVTPDVARGYLDVPGIDGLLAGGASVNYAQFSGIVDAAYKMRRELGAED